MLHCGRSVVILGMSLSTFTVVHVVLSLVGIASGVLVLLRPSASPKAWGLTTLFLATTLAASVTGLLYLLAFPRVRLGHGHRRRLAAGLRADPAGALAPSAGRPVARRPTSPARRPCSISMPSSPSCRPSPRSASCARCRRRTWARRRSSRICSCWRSACGWPSTRSPTFSPARPPAPGPAAAHKAPARRRSLGLTGRGASPRPARVGRGDASSRLRYDAGWSTAPACSSP